LCEISFKKCAYNGEMSTKVEGIVFDSPCILCLKKIALCLKRWN